MNKRGQGGGSADNGGAVSTNIRKERKEDEEKEEKEEEERGETDTERSDCFPVVLRWTEEEEEEMVNRNSRSSSWRRRSNVFHAPRNIWVSMI